MKLSENDTAIFRGSWYNTARLHMNDKERLAFYECVLSYQFENIKPSEELPAVVKMLFDIVRPNLDKDREKLQKRRDTARANGAFGGRPSNNKNNQIVTKPSQTNENPAGFFGLALYNNTDTDTITDNSVCVQTTESNNEDTHTKFLICSEFFLQGVENPIEEGRLFWNYYEARGWRTGDGQEIKNIVALSKSWHPKSLTQSLARKRAGTESLLKSLEMPDFSVFERILSVEIDYTTQTLLLRVRSKEDAIYFEERHFNAISKWVKECENRAEDWQLQYLFPE